MDGALHVYQAGLNQGLLFATQAAVEILGKRRGEQMAMLVHHSRNSVQKQWEETLVLALSGMGRILRAHLPVLVAMPGFSQVPAYTPASLCSTAWLVCLHGHMQHSNPPASRILSFLYMGQNYLGEPA